MKCKAREVKEVFVVVDEQDLGGFYDSGCIHNLVPGWRRAWKRRTKQRIFPAARTILLCGNAPKKKSRKPGLCGNRNRLHRRNHPDIRYPTLLEQAEDAVADASNIVARLQRPGIFR